MSKVTNQLIEYNGIEKCMSSNNKYFKQENIEDVICIQYQKPDIDQIVKVWVKSNIDEYNLVKTPVGTSLEGQIMTGNKLMVSGEMDIKYQYVSCEADQSVHTAQGIIPFCMYLVLPKKYTSVNSIFPRIVIEDIFSKQTSCRKIYNNLTLILIVDLC